MSTEEERRLQQSESLLSELGLGGIGGVLFTASPSSASTSTTPPPKPTHPPLPPKPAKPLPSIIEEEQQQEEEEDQYEAGEDGEGEEYYDDEEYQEQQQYEDGEYYNDGEEEEEEGQQEGYYEEEAQETYEEAVEEGCEGSSAPSLIEQTYGQRMTDRTEIYKKLAMDHQPIPKQLSQSPPQFWDFLERQMDRGDIIDKDEHLQTFIHQNFMPPTIRGKFWFNVTGGLARLKANPNVYARLRDESVGPNPTVPSPFVEQVERDVCRITVGGDRMRTPEAAEHLRAVLVTYSGQNPDIGYCQAMHLIAAHFLLRMNFDEERAYWAMDAVIRSILPADFYSESMSGIKVEIATFSAISRHCYPKVLQHLDCLGVSVDMFLTAWFLSLFINILPEAVILRVLDLLFLEGFDVMYRVVLGLLKLHETEILGCTDMGAAMMIVNNLPTSVVDPDALVTAMYSTKMTDKAEIQACREVFTEQINKGVKKSSLITLDEARQMIKTKNEQKQQQQQQQPPQPQQKKVPPAPPKAQHPRSARRKTQVPKAPPPPRPQGPGSNPPPSIPQCKKELPGMGAKVLPQKPPHSSADGEDDGSRAGMGTPQARPVAPPKPKANPAYRGGKTVPLPPPSRNKPVVTEEDDRNPFDMDEHVESVPAKPSAPPKLIRVAPQGKGLPARPSPRSKPITAEEDDRNPFGMDEPAESAPKKPTAPPKLIRAVPQGKSAPMPPPPRNKPVRTEEDDRNPFDMDEHVESAPAKPTAPPKLIRATPQGKGAPAKPQPRVPTRAPEHENPFDEGEVHAPARPSLPAKPVRHTPEEGSVRPKVLPAAPYAKTEDRKPPLPQKTQRPPIQKTALPPQPLPKTQRLSPVQANAPKPLPKVQGGVGPKPLPSAAPQPHPKLPPKPLPKSQPQKSLPVRPVQKTLPEVPRGKPLPQVVQQQQQEEEEEEYEDVFGDEYFDEGEQTGYVDEDDTDNPFFQ